MHITMGKTLLDFSRVYFWFNMHRIGLYVQHISWLAKFLDCLWALDLVERKQMIFHRKQGETERGLNPSEQNMRDKYSLISDNRGQDIIHCWRYNRIYLALALCRLIGNPCLFWDKILPVVYTSALWSHTSEKTHDRPQMSSIPFCKESTKGVHQVKHGQRWRSSDSLSPKEYRFLFWKI